MVDDSSSVDSTRLDDEIIRISEDPDISPIASSSELDIVATPSILSR
jgi:hypothetical protein